MEEGVEEVVGEGGEGGWHCGFGGIDTGEMQTWRTSSLSLRDPEIAAGKWMPQLQPRQLCQSTCFLLDVQYSSTSSSRLVHSQNQTQIHHPTSRPSPTLLQTLTSLKLQKFHLTPLLHFPNPATPSPHHQAPSIPHPTSTRNTHPASAAAQSRRRRIICECPVGSELRTG